MAELFRGTYDRHGDKLRFLVIGAWNTLFGIAVLWVVDRAIAYDPESLLQKQFVLGVSWAISITQNFFTFKLLVFRTRGNWLREYMRMYVTYAFAFAVQSTLVLTITQIFDLSVFWASLPAIVVTTIMSYVGHKHFTFRQVDAVFDSEGGSDVGHGVPKSAPLEEGGAKR